jgi:uncharacterized protein YutE (UPF0331/DUF86 family)
MPREKRDVKELKERAINSLVLAIELFNRPHENARSEATLILLHHSFEMLLKAIIKNKNGTVYAKGEKYSYGFDKCLEVALSELKIISKDERSTLSILDANRDVAVHYYQDMSEDLLYLHCQAAVTLFDDILSKSFGTKLADFIPERVLPVSTRPPKDIQLLIDSEFSQIDNLLGSGNRKGIQATARLRSVMALATASRDSAERVTEKELRKAIQRRRAGEEWKVIFPEIAQLRIDTEGEGLPISLRIRKDGYPIRIAAEGEDALIIRDRDWFDKYSLSISDVAEKLNKTVPKTRAYLFEIGLWGDPEMYGEKKIKSQVYKRYTQKALDALRVAVTQYSEEDMWEKHKDKALGRI